MARAAIGLGDDLLSATILAGAKRVLWAPAMNPEMWQSPATKRNVETLKSWVTASSVPPRASWRRQRRSRGQGASSTNRR